MAETQYSDDLTIADDAELWRLIYPGWVIPDENIGNFRVSSAAFDDSQDGSPLSMILADMVISNGRNENNIIKGKEDYSLTSLKAGVARNQAQKVCLTPTSEEPAHVSVAGKKTKAVKKRLAEASRWVILRPPPKT